MDSTTITFLGTAPAVPNAGHDAASFIVNRRYLVDTGWNAALTLRAHGLDPMDVEYLLLTHCHHDHYLGLPQLLFYRAMQRSERPENGGRAPLLKVVGPAGDVERVVEDTLRFLQIDRYPDIGVAVESIPLTPGDTFEDDAFRLVTCPNRHPVQGMCCRFTDKGTGATLAWTGDTAPFSDGAPQLVEHVRGASLLIHDATFGANPAPADNSYLHSGAPDAARLALAAGVGRLALVHGKEEKQEAARAAAVALFPHSFWPADGETVIVE
jgi:ribonuclease Z